VDGIGADRIHEVDDELIRHDSVWRTVRFTEMNRSAVST